MSLLLILALFQEEEARSPEEIEQIRTKTAYTLDREELETDLVASYLRFDEEGKKLDVTRLFLEIEYGVTDWLMAEIEIPYLLLNPDQGRGERGGGDAEFEFKARLPRWLEETDLALGAEVSILTGDEDEGLGSEETEFGFFAAASRRFGWLTAHLQVGTEVADESRAEYGLSVGLDAAPWGRDFSFLLALNGEIERGEGPGWALVPGFEFRLEEPDLQVGAGFPVGLTEEAEEWGVIVDVEIEF